MAARLQNHMDQIGLYDNFQIVCSRVRELDHDKFRIFWAHDLPGDPESDFLKDPVLRDRFHHFVFVSNWQLNAYAQHYNLPLNRCTVIPNAIDPIEDHVKPDFFNQVRLIYFSTPHRGLELLVPTYEELYRRYGNSVHLDVYSSFSLYGWEARDEPYQALFDRCKAHPGISYHGAVDNETIREALKNSHVLAYPSIWPETSCLVLIEAMSAGLVCVHSNLAALPETSASLTTQYPYDPNHQDHANRFFEVLDDAVSSYEGPCTHSKNHVKIVHNWAGVSRKWEDLFHDIEFKDPPKEITSSGVFSIKVK